MQLLNERTLKLCTVDSVISLRRHYESATEQLLLALVDTSLGEHWRRNCAHCRVPNYCEQMTAWEAAGCATNLAPLMLGKLLLNNASRIDDVHLQKLSDCWTFRVFCQYLAFAKLYRYYGVLLLSCIPCKCAPLTSSVALLHSLQRREDGRAGGGQLCAPLSCIRNTGKLWRPLRNGN